MRYSRDDAVERDLPKMPKIDKGGGAFCCLRIYRKKLKQTKILQYDEDDDDAGEGTFSEDSPDIIITAQHKRSRLNSFLGYCCV